MARKGNNNLNNMADYIQYLEKAIKHMERLVALQSDAAKYSDYYQENMTEISKINEKFKASSDKARLQNLKEEVNLIKEKVKHQAQLQAMQEIEIENAKELLNHEKELKKTKEQRQKAYQDLDKFKNKETSKINKQGSGTKLSWSNAGDYFTQNWRNRTQEQLFNDYYSEALKKAKKSKGTIDTSAIKEEVLEQVAEGMDASSTKFNLAAGLIQAGADTFKVGVDKFVNLFKSGISNQSNVYEKTFENISVRTGLTRKEYYNQQLGLNNELSKLGLRNNLRSSEIMEMWNTIVDKGYSSEQSFANAIDTILTQKIVPYLDTTSTYFQQLSITNPELMKQVRGIGASTMELSGSSVFANKYLQEMIDQLGPISEQASTDIGVDYAKASGYYEQLHAAGISDSTIGHMFYSAKQGVEDPYKIATNGSIDQKLAFYNVYRNGDLTSIADWAIAGGKSANMMANWVSEEGNQGALSSAIIAGKTSLPYSAILELNRENPDMNKAESIANQITEILDKNADQATRNYSSDKNQTNTTLQETTVENLANELAVGKEWMGHWTDLIVTAIKGVTTVLIGSVIGKGIGALSGLGGTILPGTTGLGAALGPLAGIAVGVGIAAAAANKIANKTFNNAEGYGKNYGTLYNQSVANQKENGATDETVDHIQAMVDASKGLGKTDDGQIWGTSNRNIVVMGDNVMDMSPVLGSGPLSTNDALDIFNWVSGDIKDKYGIEKSWYKTGSVEAKDTLKAMAERGDNIGYNRIKTVALASILGKYDDIFTGPSVVAALNADLLLHNLQSDTAMTTPLTEILGVPIMEDKNTLKAFMEKAGITEASSLDKVYNLFKLSTVDYYLRSSGGNYHAYPNTDKLKSEFNLHRIGLGRVPYDDYPALLHEGEAVLTASTANELRNLIVEYRENSNISASLDAIISNQTAILVTKFDEVIRTLQNLNSATTTSSNWGSQVRNNMRTMTNTKVFG